MVYLSGSNTCANENRTPARTPGCVVVHGLPAIKKLENSFEHTFRLGGRLILIAIGILSPPGIRPLTSMYVCIIAMVSRLGMVTVRTSPYQDQRVVVHGTGERLFDGRWSPWNRTCVLVTSTAITEHLGHQSMDIHRSV